VTPSLARGSHAAARTLRRNIAVEIGLGGAVLIVAAILAHTPPPVAGLHGAHSRHDGQSHDDHLHPVDAEKTVAVESRGRVAIFAVAPGRVGANAITVELYGPDGRPLAPIEVRIAVSLPGAGIEPLERPAAPAGAGRHGLARVDMPVPGRWIIGVAALVTDFEKATFEVEVAIE
jgi:copper transport protein